MFFFSLKLFLADFSRPGFEIKTIKYWHFLLIKAYRAVELYKHYKEFTTEVTIMKPFNSKMPRRLLRHSVRINIRMSLIQSNLFLLFIFRVLSSRYNDCKLSPFPEALGSLWLPLFLV